jgi:hypothetical protein
MNGQEMKTFYLVDYYNGCNDYNDCVLSRASRRETKPRRAAGFGVRVCERALFLSAEAAVSLFSKAEHRETLWSAHTHTHLTSGFYSAACSR